MAENITQLGEALNRFVEYKLRNSVIDGIVSNVNETNFTCSVMVGDVEYVNVPLRVIIGGQSSFIEIPKDKTNCTITFRNAHQNRPTMLEVHECDKIIIKIGDSLLTVTDGLFSFNNGSLGMVLSDKLTEKINALEKAYNSLLTVLKTIVIPPNGAALSTFLTSNSLITPITQKTDIESTKIKM